MADINNEYAAAPLTGEAVAVDPPLQESETPLMGNPILTRVGAPRKGKSNTALYAGVGLALVAVLAGGTYLVASGAHQNNALVTNADATPAVQQPVAATPSPAPAPASVAAAPAPIVASAETPVQPIHVARAERATRAEAAHRVARRQAARDASEEGADAAATVTPATAAAPPPTPAPTRTMVAPAPAPVITPPPAP